MSPPQKLLRCNVKGEPLISRVVTLTGSSVAQPCNQKCGLGTPIAFLISGDNITQGGSLMGVQVHDAKAPVTKTTNCLWSAPAKTKNEQPCIRCGACAEVLPCGIYCRRQLYWFAPGKNVEALEANNLFDCMNVVRVNMCLPSEISLVAQYRLAKGEIKKARGEKRRGGACESAV